MAKDKVHILGICGTFMGGLALLGKEEGIDISGCDTNIYPPMSDHLREMGIEIIEGYDANKLPDADCYCLLYTSPSPRDVEESRMPSSA